MLATTSPSRSTATTDSFVEPSHTRRARRLPERGGAVLSRTTSSTDRTTCCGRGPLPVRARANAALSAAPAARPLASGRCDRIVEQPVRSRETGRDDVDPAVTENDQMPCSGGGPGSVGDIDRRLTAFRDLVDVDERQVAPSQPVDSRRIGIARVDQCTIHRQVVGRDRPLQLRRREQLIARPESAISSAIAPRNAAATSSVNA